MNRTRTIILSLILALAALAPAAALAKNGADDNPNVPDDKGGQRVENAKGGSDAKRVTGKCTSGSTSKLKVKPDDGRLEAEFEVDQNRNGVTWKVTIRRNGKLAVKTNARTKAPSGSFSVERRLINGTGSDRVTARATRSSGEVCKASITI